MEVRRRRVFDMINTTQEKVARSNNGGYIEGRKTMIHVHSNLNSRSAHPNNTKITTVPRCRFSRWRSSISWLESFVCERNFYCNFFFLHEYNFFSRYIYNFLKSNIDNHIKREKEREKKGKEDMRCSTSCTKGWITIKQACYKQCLNEFKIVMTLQSVTPNKLMCWHWLLQRRRKRKKMSISIVIGFSLFVYAFFPGAPGLHRLHELW